MFDNASIKELYDFIRKEFPVSCIVKTNIRGKEYNIYCGMDEYDSSLDFSFEENWWINGQSIIWADRYTVLKKIQSETGHAFYTM